MPPVFAETFEQFLISGSTDRVLQFAATYCGDDAPGDRGPAVQAILAVLNDPEKLQSVVQSAKPGLRFALGVLERAGEPVTLAELAGTVVAAGFEPQGWNKDPDSYLRWAALELAEACLGLLTYHPNESYASELTETQEKLWLRTLFSDPRVLNANEPAPLFTLPIEPCEAPPEFRSLHPTVIVTRHRKFFEAMERIGGLAFSKTGGLLAKSRTQFERALGEHSPGMKSAVSDLHSLTFRVLEDSQCFEETDARCLLPSTTGKEQLSLGFPQQARIWLEAWMTTPSWNEPVRYLASKPMDFRWGGRFLALRAAWTTALAALPDPEAWYRFHDLTRALRPRLEHGISCFETYPPRPDPDPVPADAPFWDCTEMRYLAQVLQGPLYELGIVAVEPTPDFVTDFRFRLTPIGRTAVRARMGLDTDSEKSQGSGEPQGAWVIQPNLEVVAFVDRMTGKQLAFINSVAQQMTFGEHTATYRLTTDSVYLALESGLSAAAIRDQLSAGCSTPVGAGVERMISDTAARRERIRIRKHVTLIEFPTSEARDRALELIDPDAFVVAERFIGFTPTPELTAGLKRLSQRVDFTRPVSPSLSVTELGEISELSVPDLIAQLVLREWAQRLPDGAKGWRLTSEGARRAAKRGASAEVLISCLNARVRGGKIPGLLQVALRAWASGRAKTGVSIQTVPLLVVEGADLARAIQSNSALARCLRSDLGAAILPIEPSRIEKVVQILEAYGIDPGEIDVEPDAEAPIPPKVRAPRRRPANG